MTAQGEGLPIDPVKTALWLGILTAVLKGLHVLWKIAVKRFVVPLFSETARAVLAEDLKTFHAAAEVARETAATSQLTVLELERAIDRLGSLADSFDVLRQEVSDHRAQLLAIATLLDHELPHLPERRARKPEGER